MKYEESVFRHRQACIDQLNQKSGLSALKHFNIL